jgi:hypothetical protein
MKTLRILTCVMGLVLLASVTASAQRGGMGMAPPEFRGILNPTVGSGASSQMENRGAKTDMDIAVVGKEDVNGKPGYWMEITTTPPQGGGQMVMKMLFVIDGKNGSVSKMVMQMAGQPPMEMPMGMMGNQQNTSTDVRDSAEHVGAESVTTPAGTFNTEHYRAKDGSWDAWIAPQVAPWGLVKSQARDTSMTVTKLITNATDKITGTPQQMPMMPGMPGMGRGR